MNSDDLFRAIGEIDDDLIESADKVPAKHTIRLQFRHFIPAAACFCVVLLGVAAVRQNLGPIYSAEATAKRSSDLAAYDDSADNGAIDTFGLDDTAPEAALSCLPDEPDSGTLQGIRSLLLGNGSSGDSALLAHSAKELYFGQSLMLNDIFDTALPETFPVYRNTLPDTADHTDDMKARLGMVLSALGLDSALADSAVFTGDDTATIQQTLSSIQDDSTMLDYLADAARLKLTIPADNESAGLTITVSNDLSVDIVYDTSAEPRILTDESDERTVSDKLNQQYHTLFASLLGDNYTDVTDGGDCTIYGEACTVFIQYAADSFRRLLVSADADGSLIALHETNRPVELLGEYTSVSLQEADAQLAAGDCLTLDGSVISVDLSAEPERLANLRLVYIPGNAMYYLPMWEYTIDNGVAQLGDSPDMDQDLHSFVRCFVPAVRIEEIDALNGK